MFDYLKRVGVLMLLQTLTAVSIWAQSSNAQLTGLVTDATGGSVPQATVRALNTATGVAYETATNAAGVYAIVQLIPGTYGITAAKPGFEPYARDHVVLRTADRLVLDISLKVGNVRTEVTVTSESAPLMAADMAPASVIDNRIITQLPQLSRNTLDLTKVTPEVTGGIMGNFSGILTGLQGSSLVVAGGQKNGANITVDGVIMQEGESNNINRAIPSPDAVNELRVQTGVLTADIGRYSGGIITMSTQSGGNQFHGRLFEYFRNQALNANTWSNNSLGVTAKTAYHRNTYGASMGGPVSIPKLYSGRNRTFFFFGWEGERYNTGSLARSSVPTGQEKEGDFSETILKYQSGKPVYATIFDPFSGYFDGSGNWIRPAFAGSVLPESQQSRLFKNYLAMWPSANHAPDANSSKTNNYWSSTRTSQPIDRHSLKIDHNLSSDHRANLRVSRYRSSDIKTPPFFHGSGTWTYDHNWSSGLQYTWVASPSAVLDVRMGFNHSLLWNATGSEGDPAIDTGKWGWDPLILNSGLLQYTSVAPSVSVSSYSRVGYWFPDQGAQQTANANISFIKILGRHTLTMGYQHYYTIFHEDGGSPTGARKIDAGGGSNRYWNKSDGLTGYGLAELMMGSSAASQPWGMYNIVLYSHNVAAFLMDDWKVTPRLTLQLGVRWDRDGPRKLWYANTGQLFDVGARNVLTPNADWNWSQVVARVPALANYSQPGWIAGGVNGRAVLTHTPEYPHDYVFSTDWANFQPRIGISYALNSDTVLRLGSGIIYQGLNGLTANGFSSYYKQPTFAQVPTQDGMHWISALDGQRGLPMFPAMPDGSRLGYAPPYASNQELWYYTFGGAPSTTSSALLESHMRSPQEYVWSASVQRSVGDWFFSADYSGTRGIHMATSTTVRPTNVEGSYYTLGTALNTQVPNPFYGQAQSFLTQPTVALSSLLSRMPQYSNASIGVATWGKLMSHFLHFRVQTRSFHGLTLMGSYAIRKTLTNASAKDARGDLEPTNLQNPNDLMEAYALALYDVPQTWLFNYAYELPFGRGKRFLNSTSGISNRLLDAVAGGWGIAGYTSFAPKGAPVSGPSVSGSTTVPGAVVRWSVDPSIDYRNPGADYSSALIVSGKLVYPNPQTVFNKAAFVRTANYSFGNVPAVFPNVRQPGWFTTDATLMKNFYVSDDRRRSVELRMEALNLFNHPNFGSIVTNPDSPTFGGINGKSGNRTMQLGLRVFF